MKRHRRDYEMMADMNLTNLLDTAFVLLIAFIMASPSMRVGLPVDLPQVGDSKIINTPPESKEVTITIQHKKEVPGEPDWVYVGEVKVDANDDKSRDSLRDHLKGILSSTPPNKKLDINISADKDARYDVIAKVLSVLNGLELTNINLPLAPRDAMPIPAATPKAGAGRTVP